MGLLALLWLTSQDPIEDAFTRLPPGQFLALDPLAVEEIAALKLHHLLARRPMDVLLLGNSRPLPVTASLMGVSADRFFNASLTGESLRSSVLMLERLAEADRAPKLAIVTFDNAELQYYSQPAWPRLKLRWRAAVQDIRAGVMRPDISRVELARTVSRHVANEAGLLIRALTFTRVWRGVGIVLRRITHGDDSSYAPHSADAGYNADGSRDTAPVRRPYVARPLPVANRNVLPGYLSYDLERLAALSARGTRVVLFESFLNPDLVRQYLARPSQVAADTREHLVRLCALHNLECHTAPAVGSTEVPWPDEGHPPATMLAPYLRAFVADGIAKR